MPIASKMGNMIRVVGKSDINLATGGGGSSVGGAETTARMEADSTLQININTEATTRANSDSTLTSNLNLEITNRQNADSTLQNNLNLEVTARLNADSTLASNLNLEATARLNADSTLQSNLDSETTSRLLADSTLTSNLNLEVTARLNGDSTLQSNLDSETTSRLNADSTLTSNLNNETTSRLNADSTLTTNLNNEVTARVNADSVLFNKAQIALDPNSESSFTYYTRSDFFFDASTYFGFTTGTNNIATEGRIVLNFSQQFISSDLVGSLMISDAPIINALQARLLYGVGSIDPAPTVTVSVDGGTTWTSSWQQAVSGTSVISDFTIPLSTSPLFDAGTPNGTLTSAYFIAEIFQPTFRSVFTAFGAYVKLTSASTAGSVVGKLMAVSGGVPTTVIATSREVFTVGSDITVTSAYKVFSFNSVTLSPTTQYALVLYSSGMSVTLSVDQVASAPAFILGSATSADGSSWTGSSFTDLAFQIYAYGLDVKLKVVSSMGSTSLVGFGVEMVLDTPTTYAGDQTFEYRTITAAEASTGTITLTAVKFTPGSHQLHCNYAGHDFIAPDFVEIGGGVVQFPINFFTLGDVAKFYVTYGITDISNTPVTINNMLSKNDVLGSVVVPSGYTLDKPYMSIPSGATVTGAGNVETTGVVSGAGILATTGTVLSTGKAPTQPKFDVIQEATTTKGVAVQGRTDGSPTPSGYIGECFGSALCAGAGYSTVYANQFTNITIGTGGYVAFVTLNKGTYILTANASGVNGSASRMYGYAYVGYSSGYVFNGVDAAAGSYNCISFAVPVTIAANGTNAGIAVYSTAGSYNSSVIYVSAIRIG